MLYKINVSLPLRILQAQNTTLFYSPVERDAYKGPINNQRTSLHQQSSIISIATEEMISLFAHMMKTVFEAVDTSIEWKLGS